MIRVVFRSAVVTVVLFCLNWFSAAVMGMPAGLKMSGGEVVTTVGFGIIHDEFFPITEYGVSSNVPDVIRFHPLSLLCTFGILLIVFVSAHFISGLIKSGK